MPTYEYKCPECAEKSVFIRTISEKEPEYMCKTCNLKLARVYLSNVNIAFKGSGFYSTDK
jgi:putative FmdB family regulatory protein